jgi:hypothetical protein
MTRTQVLFSLTVTSPPDPLTKADVNARSAGHSLTRLLVALEALTLDSRPNQPVFTRFIHGDSMSPNVPRNKKETYV